jgi:hypothetical protein
MTILKRNANRLESLRQIQMARDRVQWRTFLDIMTILRITSSKEYHVQPRKFQLFNEDYVIWNYLHCY